MTTPPFQSKADAQTHLERLIFDDTRPDDWVQDVWGMSAMLGDSAAKLLEAFEAVVDCCPEDTFCNLVQRLEQAVKEKDA